MSQAAEWVEIIEPRTKVGMSRFEISSCHPHLHHLATISLRGKANKFFKRVQKFTWSGSWCRMVRDPLANVNHCKWSPFRKRIAHTFNWIRNFHS